MRVRYAVRWTRMAEILALAASATSLIAYAAGLI